MRTRRPRIDEVLPEYDFSRARPNKYAARYARGGLVATLDPDVAAVFPGAREAFWPESFEPMDDDGHHDGVHNFTVERTRLASLAAAPEPRRAAY
jgi:hypothetical protein